MSLCLRRCRCDDDTKTAKMIIIALSLVLSVNVQPMECGLFDVCSSVEARVQGARVNISSPGYPAAHEIPSSGRSCSCHIEYSPTSNGQIIQIMPINISYLGCSKFTRNCDRNCWSSLRVSSRMFCLSGDSKNFTTDYIFSSTSLINISYAAKKVYSYIYTGKFAFSLYVRGARELRISCNSPQRFEPTSSPNVISTAAVYANNESSLSDIDPRETNYTILMSPSQPSESNSVFLPVVVGIIPMLVVILIIASVIIILLRKSKKSSGQNSEDNPLQLLTISDLDGEVQSSTCVAPVATDGAEPRVRPQALLPPLQIPRREEDASVYDTPRRVCKRQSSNYTPMVMNSPTSNNSISSGSVNSRVNKTSLSDNIYADLNQIASQPGSDVRTSNTSPVVAEATDRDCLYYNLVPSGRRAPKHASQASYELCCSPGGDTRLEFQNSNVNGYEFYAAIREECGETVDLSNADGSLYSNDQLYCNVGQKRADNNVISQRSDMILLENPSYVGKNKST